VADVEMGPPCLEGPGTPEVTWERCSQLQGLASWTPALPRSGRVVAVAPHPDDEVLGVGGTLARFAAVGAAIALAAVTDGERSHPGQEDTLRRLRPAESAAAATRLGIVPAQTCRLGHPDGAVDEDLLASQLSDLITVGDVVLAPWARDGHPDHDRVGRAALVAARSQGATAWGYLVWAWHWASPADLPWPAARKVWLGRQYTIRKFEAIRAFESQISGSKPILPAHVLARLTRRFEVLLTS
jgi:LmbE family N-acetylglucosaminyl deacetylase